MGNINFCEEVLKEAQKLGLKQIGLDAIKSNPMFILAFDKSNWFQRSILTTIFFRILISSTFQPPAQIRIALNSANDNISWLNDIKLVIIPFLVINQDKYFLD